MIELHNIALCFDRTCSTVAFIIDTRLIPCYITLSGQRSIQPNQSTRACGAEKVINGSHCRVVAHLVELVGIATLLLNAAMSPACAQGGGRAATPARARRETDLLACERFSWEVAHAAPPLPTPYASPLAEAAGRGLVESM